VIPDWLRRLIDPEPTARQRAKLDLLAARLDHEVALARKNRALAEMRHLDRLARARGGH
jgi:hypothetical protein